MCSLLASVSDIYLDFKHKHNDGVISYKVALEFVGSSPDASEVNAKV